jgi:hypothetical protein
MSDPAISLLPIIRALALMALLAAPLSAEDAPSRTRTSDLDGFGAETVDPDERRAQPREPDARDADGLDSDDRQTQPRDVDALEDDTEDPSGHEGRTHALDEHPVESPEGAPMAIELPGQADWAPTDDPEIAAARETLRDAQAAARAALERYAEMQRANYPRGEARAEIVSERERALAALARAKQALRDVDPGVPAAPR